MKETLEDNTVLKSSYAPKTMEERREKALNYLVEKYFESKKREEELQKKLERYGRVRRWIYKRSITLKNVGTFVKETVVKPVIIYTLACSSVFSMYLGMTIGSQIIKFIESYVPPPFSFVLEVLFLFPIGFSPSILSIVLNYYLEKKKLKRMLEEYGIKI
jgi:hypothetical protein